MLGWIQIAHVISPPEAHMMKGRLEAEGIVCFLRGEVLSSVVGTLGAYTASGPSLLGGVSVLVREEDAEEARTVLAESTFEYDYDR